MTFQVGDKVRVLAMGFNGETGEIRRIRPKKRTSCYVLFESEEGKLIPFSPLELEKVTAPKEPIEVIVPEWEKALWLDDTEKQEVEPSYYDFPQGIEVRHISAHLTSFGGQAIQYVARSTRLDGRNKGNPIEDLTKALDFIQWEIDRLRELE